MSAPSWAVFHKNGKEVGKCFINCGWFHDEIKTLEQIRDYVKSHPELEFTSITAYDSIYLMDHVEEIENEIRAQRKMIRKVMDDLREHVKQNKIEINMVAPKDIVSPISWVEGYMIQRSKGRKSGPLKLKHKGDLDIMSDPNYMHVDL